MKGRLDNPLTPEAVVQRLETDGWPEEHWDAPARSVAESDQIRAATRDARRMARQFTASTSVFADSQMQQMPKTMQSFALLTVHMEAIIRRKVWWCDHFSAAFADGTHGQPFIAFLSEGVVICHRRQCTAGCVGVGVKYALAPDRKCDWCNTYVPSNRFWNQMAGFGELSVHSAICRPCRQWSEANVPLLAPAK